MTIPTIDFTGVETGDTGHTFTIPDQVVGDYVLFEPGGVPHPKTVYPVDYLTVHTNQLSVSSTHAHPVRELPE